jgi:hypothetical protein
VGAKSAARLSGGSCSANDQMPVKAPSRTPNCNGPHSATAEHGVICMIWDAVHESAQQEVAMSVVLTDLRPYYKTSCR